MNFPALTTLTLLPVAGALVLLLLPRGNAALARRTAALLSLITLAYTLVIWLRFDHASTARARRHDERREVQPVEVGIAVRSDRRIEPDPVPVERGQVLLPAGPSGCLPAGQAGHPVETTVQVDDPARTGGLVQAVDVLRDEQPDQAAALSLGEGAVRVVGLGPPEAAPADQTACPVAGPHHGVTHEGLVLDRSLSLPLTVKPAVVRNPGLGAAAGAGEHEDALVPVEERAQRRDIGSRWLHLRDRQPPPGGIAHDAHDSSSVLVKVSGS